MDVIVEDNGLGSSTFGSAQPGDEPQQLLSYDETTPYEEQVNANGGLGSSLADRIGKGKVYLLAEAGSDRSLAKKRPVEDSTSEDAEMMTEDDIMDLDPEIRPNALLFSGPPIAHLPTQRIFAYATHFDAHPLGLEWVSDTTCVLIFSSRASAQKALKLLQKTPDEEPSLEDGTISAKSIPVPLWPAEKQLSRTLEMAMGHASAQEKRVSDRKKQEAGLAGPLRMRWARKDDVKKRGARKESEFYRKHGALAGKEVVNGRDIPNVPGSRKRGREDESYDADEQRARLDRELDAFLEENSDAEAEVDNGLADRLGPSQSSDEAMDSTPASPPSKMRSDYIASDGRSKVDRSQGRWERGERIEGGGRRRGGRGGRREPDYSVGSSGLSLRDRIGGALETSSSRESDRGIKRRRSDGLRESVGGGDSRRGGGRTSRPRKTQEELDAELDAFLNGP